jgi:hypothetical protein
MKLDPVKLAHLARGVDSMAERIDYWTSERMPAPLVVRRADKQWDESKHPRGPDGKFIEGEGAAAASAAEYLAQQAKAGKKATPNGMMQHMLLNGGITKQEIWETTKANFEMSPSLNNYVSAVAATMKKKGIDVPEPPKAKKGGDAPAKPKEEANPEDGAAEAKGMNEKAFKTWQDEIAKSETEDELQDYLAGVNYAEGKGHVTAAQAKEMKATIAETSKKLASKPKASGADLPEPGESPHQQTMHQIASDPNVSLEGKMEQLKEEWKHAKGTSNKDYALALMNAVSGGNAPDPELTTVSPPASSKQYVPPPIGDDQQEMFDAFMDGKLTPAAKLNEIMSLVGLEDEDKEYQALLIGQMVEDHPVLAGVVAAHKAQNPPGTFGETSIPLPNTSSSGVQKKMHATATDPTLTTEQKIENLQLLHAGLASASNQKYAADLITSLGGKVGGNVAPAPPVVPKPLAQTSALQTELADLKAKWKGILPVNKPPVDAMEQALDKALSMSTGDEQAQALSQITPIPNPVGMGQKSANEFLAKAQQAAGITPTTAGHPSNAPLSSSLPKGPGKKLQSEIFHALEDSPAVYIETVAKFEGASGKIKARNVIDTDRIPKDAYATVTAAYGANRGDGMTQAVDKAMRDYSAHSFGKLDAATKEAVASYQGTGYGAINGALLAGGEGSGKTKERIQRIKKAIEESVIPADTPAFRGMRCSLKDLSGFDDPAKSVGRAFVHMNFASISRSESKARDFGEDVMLKMTIPAGTRGLVMGKQDWEREIMLQANSVFKIEKVEQKVTASGKAQHLVHVTYMGTKEDA